MAPEVIDLISDSDDDTSPTKKATSTLAIFQPRKQKTTPRTSLPEPRQHASHEGRKNGKPWPPARHTPDSGTGKARVAPTEQWSFVQQPNGSLADILRHEAAAPAPKSVRNGTSTAPKLPTHLPKPPTAAKRTGGSVAEERMRRSREFYMQEARRKVERPAKDKTMQKSGRASGLDSARVSGGESPAGDDSSRQPLVSEQGQDARVASEAQASMSAETNPPKPTAAAPVVSVQRASESNVQPSSRSPGRSHIELTRADSPESSYSEDVPDVVPARLPKRKPSAIAPNMQPPIKRPRGVEAQSDSTPTLDAVKSQTLAFNSTKSRYSSSLASNEGVDDSPVELTGTPIQDLHPKGSEEPQARFPATTRPATVQLTGAPAVPKQATSSTNHNTRYTEEEDALLFRLRDEGVNWEDMPGYFNGRTMGSLQVRYSTQKRKRIGWLTAGPKAGAFPLRREQSGVGRATATLPPRRKGRKSARQEGFVSWAEVKSRDFDEEIADAPVDALVSEQAVQSPATGLAARDVAHPASIDRILRARELGGSTGRNWSSPSRRVSDELQNHVLDTLGPRKSFHGTSRDVNCVAWAPNGNHFAAGSICISDERSMQYNRPYNLLLGNVERNSLLELPEHHVTRPKVTDTNNVNALHSMQETQDPRLFKTVAAVTFSQDGNKMFSAGADDMVRMYDVSTAECVSSFNQGSTVDLLSMHRDGYLATAGHRSDRKGIAILSCETDTLAEQRTLGPNQSEAHASMPVFPSALRWGIAPQQSNYLLAGFSSDEMDEHDNYTGQICLWDIIHDVRIPMTGTERNVFDIAWNPYPSSASSTFAVASAKSGRRVRSLIQCFAPSQNKAKRVLEWECPALDINDVIYCPHDDNLIAAGATDGKVYIWDKRYADRNQAPLHVLAHGATKNVLDHDREVEAADTGVRFLSWGATGNRLYSGSSDGTVKIWNPYKITEDALVKNVAHFNSAIMCGAFSPDYRDLLIGEDQGQLNLLSIDREARSVRAAKQFDLFKAPVPAPQTIDGRAAARELVDSGQIEIRAMGTHSKRQAVQGPRYEGPYLQPSSDAVNAWYEKIESAQRELNALHARVTTLDEDATQLEQMRREASERLVEAREAYRISMEKLAEQQREMLDFHSKAAKPQQHFRAQEKAVQETSLEHAMEQCNLDCAYYSTGADADGEAPDSQMSEQRIPGKLVQSNSILDASDLSNAEIIEAGLTSKCCSCMGPAAAPKRGLPKCQRCFLKQSGLTARCSKCSAPVPLDLDNPQKQVICQSCDFHCLRCGRTAMVSSKGRIVTCRACRVQWEAGALGYEVHTWSRKAPSATVVSLDDSDEAMETELGEEEIQRHASLWHMPLVDGI